MRLERILIEFLQYYFCILSVIIVLIGCLMIYVRQLFDSYKCVNVFFVIRQLLKTFLRFAVDFLKIEQYLFTDEFVSAKVGIVKNVIQLLL